MESFRGTLKNDLVYHNRCDTRVAAPAEITEYIEIYRNGQRRRSKLGNLPPAPFAQQARMQTTIA